MEHIAIDLGGRESQVCIRDAGGAVLIERRCRTAELPELLGRRQPSRVVLETCSEAFGVADAALQCGHEVRVVPATLVRSLGVGARGVKTDRRDAQILSEVSCRVDLPSVHIPGQLSRERKAMCTMREALTRSRTLLINSVRGWMRQQAIRIGRGGTATFAERVRAALKTWPGYIDRQLQTITMLTEQLRQSDRELAQTARQDPVCRRLMTVPGVGPVTAVRFVAGLDDISRFKSAHHVASYIGLVPGERSSSDRERRTGITKAGSTAIRRVLILAAWAARRARRKDAMQLWAAEVERRRGRFVAICALARKLAGVMYALWRDASVYDSAYAMS
jgi:transposase